MIYAILAAGEGSRLSDEGITSPKPLVEVCGETLIGRLAGIMAARPDCERIEIVISGRDPEVEAHLRELSLNVPLGITVKATGGSMESLAALAPHLRGHDFCLSTVDSVFHPLEFNHYVDSWLADTESDGYMAVTTYADDEKPLYVGADPQGRITGFFDTPAAGVSYVSGGIYLLRSAALDELTDCIDAGHRRMRDFQRALVASGMHLTAWPFSRIIDVDHASDIDAAAELLSHKPNPSPWQK
ncbi:MAG: NTP transferase domain-containing protein [Muribaculaceae bacterium]|nr:NTP transferase domain-containing protein [Muribaculaceae bacterium]